MFVTKGLKKVTIDDLAEAANIAKATFYTFFESKEDLFLEMAMTRQQQIFDELKTVLGKNMDKPAKHRVQEVSFEMNPMLAKHSLLANIDEATVNLIARKVSPQRL